MNIDERLEALAHSVELLAAMQQTTDKQLKRLGKYVYALGKYVHAIGNMVFDHEDRLRSLEGDEPDEPEEE